MYYVYVLQFIDGKERKFYIGYTADLQKRIADHKRGSTKSSRGRKFILIYYEAFKDKYLAIKREKAIKNSGSVRTGLMKRLQLK